MSRAYEKIRQLVACTGDRQKRMRVVVDALWGGLRNRGVSWVGFYVHEGGDGLILAAREPKPACSPIGLHGACGRVFASGQPLVVYDVKELGEGYIACDPRDRSEVVVPCLYPDGSCWGVLDLDSHDVDSFDTTDVRGLQQVLRAANLSR
jgi:L-methionine (R)-S-oxide reductase